MQVAHNRKVDGVTHAEVLLNLGREDTLDRDGLTRLVASINRYLGEPGPAGLPAEAAQLVGDHLRVAESRPMGTVHLLDGLWRMLGVDDALKRALGSRRFTTDVERVLFALVANRALDPCSKLAAAEWATRDVAIPGLVGMDEDQAYRAMDLLVEADTCAEVQEQVFFTVANLFNLEVDMLFFDTTSTYFERDTPTSRHRGAGFRRYGHSKDHRSDLPQVIIGLAVTKEGIPVRVWSGRQHHRCTAVLPEGEGRDAGLELGPGDHDRGPRVLLEREPGLPAPRRRDVDRRGEDARPLHRRRASSWRAPAATTTSVDEHLKVKEVTLESTPGARWIVCCNTAEAAKTRPAETTPWTTTGSRVGPHRAAPHPRRTSVEEGDDRQDPRPASEADGAGKACPRRMPDCAEGPSPPWAATCANSPLAGWPSTAPRSQLRPNSTANICCPPPTST